MTSTTSKPGTDLAPADSAPGEIVPAGQFIALNHSPEEIGEAISINLGGQDVTEFDLVRLKVPAGGGATWEVDTLEGTQSFGELTGIVVHAKQTRAYWKDRYSGASNPPDCASPDGRLGVGDPGGDCATCPFAQFGSAIDEKGQPARGQACKQIAQWFVLVENSFLPCVVTMPPTSLKAAKAYMLNLAGAGLRYDMVLTKLSLERTQNAGGIRYSFVQPRLAGRLEADAAARARSYADMLRPVFDATTVVEGDLATSDTV